MNTLEFFVKMSDTLQSIMGVSVSLALRTIYDTITGDVEASFLKTLAVESAWGYSDLHEDIAHSFELCPELRAEEFARRRGSAIVGAMVRAARQHGVPFNFRTLECNGQSKLLLKVGRVIIIQEPMLTLLDAPRASDYKRELADSHGLIRQLEFAFGEPDRIVDWSGTVLAVLLHGGRGARFCKDHCTLGGLMLAVPNAGYDGWVMRLDIHQVAMFGYGTERTVTTQPEEAGQQDKVSVRLRRKRATGTGE